MGQKDTNITLMIQFGTFHLHIEHEQLYIKIKIHNSCLNTVQAVLSRLVLVFCCEYLIFCIMFCFG